VIRLFVCGPLVLALLAALSGCDNNPNPPPAKKTRADGSPWIVSYRGFSDDPRSLDPQFTYDEISHRITSSVYETLLSYEPFREDYVLMPELGAQLPVLVQNADGTSSYICKIKPGIHFQDDPCFPDGKGRELTSRDFVFAFQRMADPKVECPIASNLQEFLVGMDTAWNTAKNSGHFDYDAPFSAVEAVDRHTFKINLKKPYPQIRYWLAFPFTTPVPREAVEFYDGKVHDGKQRPQFKFHPVGTGAFRLAQWQRGRLIRLVRNDNYTTLRFPTSGWPGEHADRYLPHAGKALPLVDEVQLIIMRESIPAWILFKQGWLDASGVGKDVFNSVITTGKDLSPDYKARGIELEKDIELSTSYVMFNMQDPLLGANKKLRQALSTVFDSATANEIFFNGIFLEAQQLLPPGLFGAEKDFANPYRTGNLEKARALLAEAGYPGGIDPKTGRRLEIVLDATADDGASRQLTEYEKSQFEKLGLRVRIEENIFAQMLDKQTSGAYQFLFVGWNADYPDPENYFFLFYGPNIPPRGYNQARYDNPEFNRLFEQMATMEDSPARKDVIRRMNAIMTEDAVIIPLFTPVRYALMQPWAKRIVLNPLVSKGGALKYIWIDAPMREIERRKLNKKNYWPLVVAALVLTMLVGYGIRRRNQANV
jgi:ABC-type transport system substrate-binding protein